MWDGPDIIGYIQYDANTACERLVSDEDALTLAAEWCADDTAPDVVVFANLSQLSAELQQEWEFVRQRMRRYSPRARA